jgi:AcrR family transcriptional regulator
MSAYMSSTRSSTGEWIRSSAACLFAQAGYNGVSTREIAATAEINEGTIYWYFPRRRDLSLAVLGVELQRIQLRGESLMRLVGEQNGETALTCEFELITTTFQRQQQLLRLLHSTLDLGETLDPLLRTHVGGVVEVAPAQGLLY